MFQGCSPMCTRDTCFYLNYLTVRDSESIIDSSSIAPLTIVIWNLKRKERWNDNHERWARKLVLETRGYSNLNDLHLWSRCVVSRHYDYNYVWRPIERRPFARHDRCTRHFRVPALADRTVYTHSRRSAQARKCGSKCYLGRWAAFMATGPIEQVRRNGYTHIKRRGKRFHYSFVHGTEALHYAKTFAREKRRGDKRSQRRMGRAKNGTSATRFSGPKWRGSRPVVVDKNYPPLQIDDFGHLKLFRVRVNNKIYRLMCQRIFRFCRLYFWANDFIICHGRSRKHFAFTAFNNNAAVFIILIFYI